MVKRYKPANRLFSRYDLSETFRKNTEEVQKRIQELDPKYLIETPLEDLARFFEDEYHIEPLKLDCDGISISGVEDVEVDISNDFHRVVRDRSKPAYFPFPQVNYLIPYEGDPQLLEVGSHFDFNLPEGNILANEIHIPILAKDIDINQTSKEFDHQKNKIQSRIDRVNSQLAALQKEFSNAIRIAITNKQVQRNKQLEQIQSLPYPIKSSEPGQVVSLKKRIKPAPVPARRGEEFLLSLSNYEDIIETIDSSARTFEQNPKPYQQFGEEDFRVHFLASLNGVYEGLARGEVFNKGGKTDILLAAGNRNIFIAECKIYDGPQSVSKAVDQLLSYLTWRDTKAAVILFSRNKEFTDVINKSVVALNEHQYCISGGVEKGEGRYYFRFRQPSDSQRYLDLTLMLFDISFQTKSK